MHLRGSCAGLIIVAAFLASCQQSAPRREGLTTTVTPYEYPVENPYVATVVGTPKGYGLDLPREIPVEERSLDIHVGRSTPEVLWYEDSFRYSLAAQPNAAPLVFIIPGTNAGHHSRFSSFMQKLFYAAGFHVVALSSPTYPNFMVTASGTGVPGRTSQDATDLYHVMQLVLLDIKGQAKVSDVLLVGFSLGAWDAAFVANLDDQGRAINFRKIVLINPPVSLYRSSLMLDRMLSENLPGGLENLDAFIDRLLAKLTDIYSRSGAVEMTQDSLYAAFSHLQVTQQELKALIGITFRLLAANIAFTADVINHFGYLVPSHAELRTSTSLTPYFDRAMHHGFEDYLENFLYPYYNSLNPGLSRQELIMETSLESIQEYLRNSKNIAVMTNADDIILAPGDIEFLKEVFGDRAYVLPSGGHGGNLEEKHVCATMLKLLAE